MKPRKRQLCVSLRSGRHAARSRTHAALAERAARDPNARPSRAAGRLRGRRAPRARARRDRSSAMSRLAATVVGVGSVDASTRRGDDARAPSAAERASVVRAPETRRRDREVRLRVHPSRSHTAPARLPGAWPPRRPPRARRSRAYRYRCRIFERVRAGSVTLPSSSRAHALLPSSSERPPHLRPRPKARRGLRGPLTGDVRASRRILAREARAGDARWSSTRTRTRCTACWSTTTPPPNSRP